MDTPTDYQTLIKNLLLKYIEYSPAGEDFQVYTLFDDTSGNYALIETGWQPDKYWHHTIIHVGYKNGKIWIYCDNTDVGVATEFVAAGVPKEQIVLGFRPIELRQYTGFAVA
jgi:hypothetical protein